MKTYNDFTEQLSAEVLTDMAEHFFGTRKQLEGMTDLFMSYAEILRKMAKKVAAKAGFLNYLLGDRQRTFEFFQSVVSDSPEIFLEDNFSDDVIPHEIPFAFTKQGEFTKFVIQAYENLQQACDEYNNGKYHNVSRREREDISVNYNLMLNMYELLTKEVDKVNNDMAPTVMLQCFKNFDPLTMEKESISGSLFHGSSGRGLDRSLAYDHIDFDALNLTKYPELPKQSDISGKLTALCKKIFSENKSDVRQRLSGIEEKIKGKAGI